MSTSRDRLVWFLADPTLTEDDFKAIRKLLSGRQIDRIFSDACRLRDAVRHDSREENKHPSRSDKVNQFDDPLVDGVYRLLLREASFPVRSALSLLAAELGYDGSISPFVSLKNGVALFCEQFDPSQILSAAQRIRNRAVHNSPNLPGESWPLRKQQDDANS